MVFMSCQQAHRRASSTPFTLHSSLLYKRKQTSVITTATLVSGTIQTPPAALPHPPAPPPSIHLVDPSPPHPHPPIHHSPFGLTTNRHLLRANSHPLNLQSKDLRQNIFPLLSIFHSFSQNLSQTPLLMTISN